MIKLFSLAFFEPREFPNYGENGMPQENFVSFLDLFEKLCGGALKAQILGQKFLTAFVHLMTFLPVTLSTLGTNGPNSTFFLDFTKPAFTEKVVNGYTAHGDLCRKQLIP